MGLFRTFMTSFNGALKIGRDTNYTLIEEDGTLVAQGDATCWDDIYVYPEALDVNGSNPPVRKLFQNDGSGGTDSAVRFIDNTGAEGNMYTTLENAIEGGEFTIAFDIKPERANLEYVLRFSSNCWIRLSRSGGSTRIYYDFGFSGFSSTLLNIGSWNRISISVSKLFNYTRIWSNGQQYQSSIGTTPIVADSTFSFGFEGSTTSSLNYQGAIDLVQVFDTVWTDANHVAWYNNGIFTDTLPSGITDADRVLHCQINEDSGNTIGNTKGNDLTIEGTENTDFEWIEGSIGNSGSFGVYLKTFEYGQRQSAGLNFSPSHRWVVGTNLKPHVHFSIVEQLGAGDTIKFGMEIVGVDVNGTYPLTDTLVATYTATGDEDIRKHCVVSFPEIDMSSFSGVSPHFIATFYRYSDDTFTGDVFLLNQGTHYKNDMIGSHEEFVK